MLQTASAPSTEPGRQVATPHRDDIQVLRAVAVVLVVLYHLGVPGFDAGFVGVDVFFVISGYLISRLLIAELLHTGRVALGRFTARRVKRLLPLSFLVLISTMVMVRIFNNPLRQLDELPVARAAATYRANVTLAGRGVDYLATDQASAFQHYWSLAIEEQFYLLLPAALLAAHLLAGRRRVVRTSTLLLGAATILSLAIAVDVSASSPSSAYFLLHTRAWEFGVGGLLACAELAHRRPGSASGWRITGVIGLVVAMLVSHRLAFPGPGALPAVLGTAALIWGGIARSAADLSSTVWAPLRWIGDRSYSIYLWHWPPIVVFNLDTTPFGDRWTMRLAVLGCTVLASAWSFRVVEQGVRFRSPSGIARTLGLLAALTLAGYLAAARLLSGSIALDGPMAERLVSLDDGVVAAPAALPANLRPALTEAKHDLPVIYDNDCHAELTQSRPRPVESCTFGGSGAGGTILLVGDSHAAQWFDPLEEIATEADARLVVATKSACSLTGPIDEAFAASCESWRDATTELLVGLQPDIVVAANAAGREDRREPAGWVATVAAGLESIRLAVPDAEVVFVLDTPIATADVTHCLVARSPLECGVPADVTFNDAQRVGLAPVADRVVDVLPMLCNAEVCPAVMGDVLVYRDRGHLSRSVVDVLGPELENVLLEVGLGG
ncbi:MAG: acyltransferase family protein [Actinomycetota bacterium]